MTAVSIVSIPHTGTKFTEYVLLSMGCDVRHAHLHSEHPAQHGRKWLHNDPKVVVPWREPSKVNASTIRRGEQLRPAEEFAELLEWANQPNVHLFTIEPENRAVELAALAEFVGVDVPDNIDWTPCNCFQGAA